MKFLFTILFLLLMTKSTFSQIPDSTLENLFEGYEPEQLKQLLQANHRFDYKPSMKEYIAELSFKLPNLNPISNQKINSQFGYRMHPITGEIKQHQGIDLAGKSGQAIHAAADGEITAIGFNSFLGNYVKIKHLLGFETVYGHLHESSVALNSMVYQGQIIGYCGSTGRTTGVHLHFAVLWKNEFQNPYFYVF
jgi:murein DD-endopeptidase MepM/ murein hydrolase activator NlpD